MLGSFGDTIFYDFLFDVHLKLNYNRKYYIVRNIYNSCIRQSSKFWDFNYRNFKVLLGKMYCNKKYKTLNSYCSNITRHS